MALCRGRQGRLLDLPRGAESDYTDATVTITYYHENGQLYTQTEALPARRRITLPPPAAMPDGGFAMRVQGHAGAPIVAERSVYFGPYFEGGDTSSGWPVTSPTWRFANGRAMSFWSTYYLLFNPSATPATVTLTHYRTAGGASVTQTVTVPAQQRVVVFTNSVAGLSDTEFWTSISATNGVGIVAERAMFWPGWGWYGSHLAVGR